MWVHRCWSAPPMKPHHNWCPQHHLFLKAHSLTYYYRTSWRFFKIRNEIELCQCSSTDWILTKIWTRFENWNTLLSLKECEPTYLVLNPSNHPNMGSDTNVWYELMPANRKGMLSMEMNFIWLITGLVHHTTLFNYQRPHYDYRSFHHPKLVTVTGGYNLITVVIHNY